MLDSSVSLMVVLSPAGQILQINRAITKTLGFSHDELRIAPIASALLVPEELSVVEPGVGAGRQIAQSALDGNLGADQSGRAAAQCNGRWPRSRTKRKIWSKSF